jgi:hypothetical protein
MEDQRPKLKVAPPGRIRTSDQAVNSRTERSGRVPPCIAKMYLSRFGR